MASLRLAAQPANVRDDLRAFPDVALHSKAIWVPGLLVLVSGVVLIYAGVSGNVELTKSPLVSLAAQLFIVPPPMIPVFLAGMLAPRGAYLAGFAVGLLSAILFSIYAMTATIPDGAVVAGDVRSSAILYALAVSPIFGLAIGGFAGFYRRFLRMAQPASPRQGRNDKGKPATRRS